MFVRGSVISRDRACAGPSPGELTGAKPSRRGSMRPASRIGRGPHAHPGGGGERDGTSRAHLPGACGEKLAGVVAPLALIAAGVAPQITSDRRK